MIWLIISTGRLSNGESTLEDDITWAKETFLARLPGESNIKDEVRLIK